MSVESAGSDDREDSRKKQIRLPLPALVRAIHKPFQQTLHTTNTALSLIPLVEWRGSGSFGSTLWSNDGSPRKKLLFFTQSLDTT